MQEITGSHRLCVGHEAFVAPAAKKSGGSHPGAVLSYFASSRVELGETQSKQMEDFGIAIPRFFRLFCSTFVDSKVPTLWARWMAWRR